MLIDEVESGKGFQEVVSKFNEELGDEALALLRALICERRQNNDEYK